VDFNGMSKYQQTNREESGRLLQANVKRLNDRNYEVKSLTRDEIYKILVTSIGWVCSCADHVYRGVKCKHIYAVEFSLELRETIKKEIVIQPVTTLSCCYCNSENIVKKAIRHNKNGDIQRYLCKECGKRFSFNIGFDKMHATPQMITSAIQLYFTGESFRNIKNFLKLQGVNISHVTVYKWLVKYVALMNKYLEKIKPDVGQAWRTDELYLKVKGNTKYLYALMDDETRFWIAQQVADTKNTADITPLFSKGKEVAGTRPNTLISDGAPNFHTAFNRELYTNKWPRSRHINHIRLQGDHNNNKMERMNGEIRDREKTMRGLKKSDTPILKGYQIYHNYMRPHESLNGETPAERCGIKIEGQNKWVTLIQNASQK
jgi:putative transposase